MSRARSRGLLLASLVGVLAVLDARTTHASLSKRVSGNLVFWDQSRGFEAIVANADVFSDISPFWYRVDADGRVVPFTTDLGASYEDPAILSFLRAKGIRVIPTVANILNGVWDGALVSGLINDPVRTTVNISSLVQLAVTKGYDGIDLDYENLSASDRPAFTNFVSQLAVALHASGKLLTVNVYAKTAEPGTWNGPQAQDWGAIGQAVDQVRIMTYEYHWSTSGPGPIAPINWVGDVLAFARTTMPAQKIMQGIPLYVYDWWVNPASIVRRSSALALQFSATVNWNATSSSPWFEYLANRTRHTGVVPSTSTVDTKLGLNTAHGVGGVNFWRLGGGSGDLVGAENTLRGRGCPGGLNSAHRHHLFACQRRLIAEKAADRGARQRQISVSRVEFYVNDALLAT